jgi:hypothetical protein
MEEENKLLRKRNKQGENSNRLDSDFDSDNSILNVIDSDTDVDSDVDSDVDVNVDNERDTNTVLKQDYTEDNSKYDSIGLFTYIPPNEENLNRACIGFIVVFWVVFCIPVFLM